MLIGFLYECSHRDRLMPRVWLCSGDGIFLRANEYLDLISEFEYRWRIKL